MECLKNANRNFGKVGKVSAVASILLAILILTYANEIDINNPDSCPKDSMNMSSKNICCINLNRRRRPFAECCKYPLLVIWRWQFEICTKKCDFNGVSQNDPNYRCCVLPCCFQYCKVIGANPEVEGINKDGLAYSFLLSVGNDTRWKDIIYNSVTESDRQYRQDIKNMSGVTDALLIKEYENFWECFEMIPKYLFDMIDFAYIQNYLQCPVYNTTLDRCDLSKRYLQDCIIDGNE